MGREERSSLFWLGVGVLICILSLRLSLGTFHNPAPGFFPFIAGAVLGSLSLVYYFQSRRAPSPDQPSKPIWKDRNRGVKMVLTFLALLAYAVGMEYLGFLTSTVLFLGFLLRVIHPQRWMVVITGSGLVSVVSYCIFELILEIQLPKGPWEVF